MKFSYQLAKRIMMISIFAFVFAGCKKQIFQIKKEETLAKANSASNCKPTGLGILVVRWDGYRYWTDAMLKWYDQNGTLTHLKSSFWLDPTTPPGPSKNVFTLDYAELLYLNDTIFLKDVYFNRIILKVKLDERKRPQTSWFRDTISNTLWTDTSHYYYSQEGRIDSVQIRQQYTIPGYNLPPIHYTYRFLYDGYGNLIRMQHPSGRVNFKYDYTQTNEGIIGHYVITIPLTLLQYMDLIDFPHIHQLVKVVLGAYWPGSPIEDETYPVYTWRYYDVKKNAAGFVYSYKIGRFLIDTGFDNTFFNAWDCTGKEPWQTRNPSQTEFMQIVH